jgi:hypothetical protein
VALVWDSFDVDSDSGWSAGAPTRYTFHTAGWWSVSGGVGLTGGTHTRIGTNWALNGVQAGAGQSLSTTAGSNGVITTARSMSIFGNVGDYAELQWLATYSAGTPTTLATFSSQPGMSLLWVHT